jgi:hypothetical protein
MRDHPLQCGMITKFASLSRALLAVQANAASARIVKIATLTIARTMPTVRGAINTRSSRLD